MTPPVARPELALLLGCCRWNFAAERERKPEIPANLDWREFVRLAQFHRVQGLVWNALSERTSTLPPDVALTLSGDTRSIAATNLAIARECAELAKAFEQMPLLFIKGLTVAALAYRQPMLKMGWDIDMLVEPRDLTRAAHVLAERGYSLRLPSSRLALEAWHERSKESVWTRPDGLHVELHTRLADNPALIPSIDVRSRRQEVEVAEGIRLSTLADNELFAYLVVHGASSAWFRLKWICDFAALCRRFAAVDIERMYRRSQELGAGRAAGQALLLADALFGALEGNSAFSEELLGDRSTRLLFRTALKVVSANPVEPTERRMGTWPIHWSQLFLLPGLGYKVRELSGQAGRVLQNRVLS